MVSHNGFLTPLAVIIILFAAFAALEVARTATALPNPRRGNWVFGAGLVIGMGIWAMHFAAMVGTEIAGAEQSLLVIPTLLSLIPAIGGTALAFGVVAFKGLRVSTLMISAALMTAGITSMHYVGMTAWHLSGIHHTYEYQYVTSAVAIAFVASLGALWLAFRTTNARFQLVGALALAVGALGLHYVAAAGMAYELGHFNAPTGPAIDDLTARRLSAWAGFITIIISTAAIMHAKNARHVIELQFSTNDTLRQSQKMEALGQLTGGIAHDFNNLLQVISGSLDILDRDPSPERSAKFRAAIRQASDRGSSLTRQLLAFSRRQNFVARPVNLAQHLNRGKELWSSSVTSAGSQLEISIPDDLWNINVDVDALDVAILNMVINARDAMPDGGTVTIKAQNHYISPGSMLNYNSRKVGEYVEICISDTGEGMSKEVQQRAFEPFFTTKDVGKGTGLGLSQVYGFTEHSEGSISIDSTIGKGTTMRLFFPRTLVEIPKVVGDQDGAAKVASGSILVVEDDPNVASITRAFLEELGYDVWFAGTAVSAAFALKERQPEIILTDIILPGGMSGLDLAQQVAENYPEIPVVLMTGYTPEMDRVQSLGFPVMRKPYLLDDLAKTLENAKRK